MRFSVIKLTGLFSSFTVNIGQCDAECSIVTVSNLVPLLHFFYFCFMQSTINHWGSPSRSIYYQYWCYWSLLRNPIVTSVFFFLVVVYYLITSKQWCAEILANEDIQPKRRKPFSAEMFLEVKNHLASKKQLSLLQWCFDRVMVSFMHTMSMSYSW